MIPLAHLTCRAAEATEQTQLVTHAPQADSYLQSREAAIMQITSDIQGLSSMFGQLAAMVQEQGEMALRIDDNVDNVVTNVDAAQVQLLKYLQTISNNRWLALKVFGILLVFVLLFIVLMIDVSMVATSIR
jgi:syntaxin 5